jgi:hypothetical protein
MREDPAYRPRFLEAEKRAARGLEDEAVRRAREGVRKLVLYKGKPVYVHGEPLYETEYSDRLLERLLEANDPERFRRNVQQTNINEVDWNSLSPEKLDVLLDGHMKKMLGTSDPKVLESAKRQLDEGKTVIEVEVESSLVETRPT